VRRLFSISSDHVLTGWLAAGVHPEIASLWPAGDAAGSLIIHGLSSFLVLRIFVICCGTVSLPVFDFYN